jgi:tetratricopeptide (TPR) repeat protein
VRVAKHKKQPRLRFLERVGQPAPADPEQAGLRAFLSGNLQAAITQWSTIAAPREAVKAALAEAYFRRGMLATDPALRHADLDRAERLQADDVRISYVLGIEAHRRGDFAQASTHYRAALTSDPSWPGVALLLGLATLHLEPRADLATLPGSTPEARATLAPIQTLMQAGVPPLNAGTALDSLWHGLGLIDAGDGSALPLLDDNRPLPAAQAGVIRRYYRGVAAAQSGDMDAAFKAWRNSLRPGRSSPWLRSNMVVMLLENDGARLDQEDLLADSPLTRFLYDEASTDIALAEQLAKSLDRAARQASEARDWSSAAARWEKARSLISAVPALGTPRRLHHNLAIAYEMMERWHDAAEAWRALLRTRPRGVRRAQAGREPDYSDTQWRWIQDRVIECYKRADTPGEAVTLYRQALKKAPQDVELHMGLALALIANEQEQAATNELQRVLEIDPKHIDARVELSDLIMDYDYQGALRLLRGAHADAPDRDNVTHALASALRDAGRELHADGSYKTAIALYEEGSKLLPDDWEFPLDSARVYFDQKKPAQGRERLEQVAALVGNDPRGRLQLIATWAASGDFSSARDALEQAESLPGLPYDFHLELAKLLLASQKAPQLSFARVAQKADANAERLQSLAVEFIERGAARNADNADYHDRSARALMLELPAVAMGLASEAVRLAPGSPQNLITLGLMQGLNGLSREAEQTLRGAARLARKQGNTGLADTATAFIRLTGNATSLREELMYTMAFEQLKQLGIGGMLDDLDIPDDIDSFGL